SKKPMKKALILIISFYQKLKNGINLILLSLFGVAFSCRQNPSCSQYLIKKIKERGILLGVKKGLIRAINCY
ncbi:MAG: membrane protein insertion efficiency factor YidD, partial [Patescibacteria group bacterium]